MPAIIVPASLENIDEAFEICVDIGVRMIDRMAHAGLRREMDHHRKSMFGKQQGHRPAIREIELHKTEPRILTQDIQSRLLQGGVVVIIKVVQTDNMTALGQQLAGDVKTNKTRRTCDQNCLIRHHILKGIVSAPLRQSEPLYPPQ